jgi:mannose-6-phosphate isomerase-like protein (cupin superfamily)
MHRGCYAVRTADDDTRGVHRMTDVPDDPRRRVHPHGGRRRPCRLRQGLPPVPDRPRLSAGIYALPAGGEDTQSPHDEDEIYVVLTGRAFITINGTDYPAARGDTIFVAKHVEHRFHTIEEDLRLLVVFAPAHTPQE